MTTTNTPPITPEQHQALIRPFPPGEEQYRVGPSWAQGESRYGRPLAYIDARAVYDRLDEVMGPGSWETRLEQVAPGKWKCALCINGIVREDVGEAGGEESEKEKSAVSDAVKRAAVQFGIGRYLYAMDLPPVQLERRRDQWFLPRGWKPAWRDGVGSQPTTPPPSPSDPKKANHIPANQPVNLHGLTDADKEQLLQVAKEHGFTPANLKQLTQERFGFEQFMLLTPKQYDELLEAIPRIKKSRAKKSEG